MGDIGPLMKPTPSVWAIAVATILLAFDTWTPVEPSVNKSMFSDMSLDRSKLKYR